jgi:hypothetical protein
MVKRRDFIRGGMLLTAGVSCSSALLAESTGEYPTNHATVSLNKKIPVRYDADVVVIGGGISGVSAACSAASSGASVILVEGYGTLGGDLTMGGVANFCGQIDRQGEVFDEVLSNLKKFNSLGEGDKASVFNYEILALVLQEIILKRRVKLLLHTKLVDVLVKGSKITECVICGKSGLEAIRGKVFIDCSGDADLARFAGIPTMKGDEKTGYQLPMSKIFFVREVDEPGFVLQTPNEWPTRITVKEDLPMVSVWPDGPSGKAIKLKIPMFDSTTTEGLTKAEIQAKRRTMDVLYYYQNIEKRKWRLTGSAAQIGIREGSRIIGDYILKVEDLRRGCSFDDGVARGTFYLDGHGLTDDKRTYILPQDQLKVPPYQIPMRSLVAKDAENLLMAGRCMSADQLALSSARVSTSCSMMGQATGIAAAMAVLQKTKIRNLDYSEIKTEVLKRGAQLDVSKQVYTIHG